MAKTIRYNLYLFEHQDKFIRERSKDPFFRTQDWLRKVIERAITEQQGEEKKIANFQKEQK